MNAFELAVERLARLGLALGVDPLVFDADGQVAFDIGHGLTLQLGHEPETASLLFTSVAAELPADVGAELLTELLRANFLWRDTAGATLSLDGSAPAQVVVARRLPLALLGDDELLDAFNGVVGLIDDLHAWLGEHTLLSTPA